MLDEISSTGDLIAGGRIARLADAAQENTDAQMDELDQSRRSSSPTATRCERRGTVRTSSSPRPTGTRRNSTDALAVVAGDLQVAEQQQALDRYLKAVAAQQAAPQPPPRQPPLPRRPPPPPPKEQKPPADPALAARSR